MADSEALKFIEDHLIASKDAITAAIAEQRFIETVLEISELLTTRIRGGHKVLLAGNGGSAADAQHIAGEFISRLNFDRSPIASLALTTDTSVLTAIGNDYGYEQVFARQVCGLGRPNDVLIAISTSGRSPNIIAAIHAARSIGISTVGLTGNRNGEINNCCDIVLNVPSSATPIIQQIHMTVAHAICGVVEKALFSPRDTG